MAGVRATIGMLLDDVEHKGGVSTFAVTSHELALALYSTRPTPGSSPLIDA